MRSRVLFPLGALAAASAWCVVLLAVRKYEYGYAEYKGLVWNLALAWIPLGLAALLVVAYARRRSRLELAALGFAWLLFLPNAPYVLTDFVHLGSAHRVFDSLLIASFAFTSLALGFASLLLVQLVVTRIAGALFGWLTAIVSLFAASVGASRAGTSSGGPASSGSSPGHDSTARSATATCSATSCSWACS